MKFLPVGGHNIFLEIPEAKDRTLLDEARIGDKYWVLVFDNDLFVMVDLEAATYQIVTSLPSASNKPPESLL
jgi:hypothetical protein